MDTLNNHTDVDKTKHKQILKLVTNSFYRELVNYGINNSDIVTVSVNLLDHITQGDKTLTDTNDFYNALFKPDLIQNCWHEQKLLAYDKVQIKPLQHSTIPLISDWLKSQSSQQTFIRFFPKNPDALQTYLLEKEDRHYFQIQYEEDNIVGIIGAHALDPVSKKIEMKKFVGSEHFRGRGIGKLATFLFLYYAFEIIQYNKVFINSMDTNIQNINLNSRFGFELEGILYKEVLVNGNYRDVLRMSLLKETWQKLFNTEKVPD